MLLAQKDITDETRNQLIELQKQLPVGVSVVEQRRKTQEKAAAEKKKHDEEQAARDKAAAEQAEKDAKDREDEIKRAAQAKIVAEKEYDVALLNTQTLLDSQLITQKAAAEENVKSAEKLLDTYLELGIRSGPLFDTLVSKIKELREISSAETAKESIFAKWQKEFQGYAKAEEENFELIDKQITYNENLGKSSSDLARKAGEDRKKYFDTILADAEESVRGLSVFGSAAKSLFVEIGQDLANGELSWASLGEAAVHSLGKIVNALGDYLAAEAAKDLVLAIADASTIIFAYLAPGLFASAATKAAGAAAAYVTGAMMEAAKFETGGIVLPSGGSSGKLVSVAEGGSSELLLNNSSAGRAMLTQFASEIARQIQGGSGGVAHVSINVDGRELGKAITRITYDGKTRIYKGVVKD
jgi:hypothetical protein